MPVLRRLAAAVSAALALSAPGQGMGQGGGQGAAAGPCFTEKLVLLPDPDRVRPSLSTGRAGREAYDAIRRGDREGAAARLRADPGLAATVAVVPPGFDSTPDGLYGDLLTFAVAACDGAMLRALLDAGLPPDGAEPGLALGLALLADDLGMAGMLLEAGASPDPQKRGGVNLLETVAGFGDAGAARLLLRHGLDVAWADGFGRGHLDVAVAMGSWEVAEALAAAGASPWLIDRDGFMPVHGIAAAPAPAGGAEGEALVRLRALAKRPGLPWPPPDAATVRARVLAGEWPTPGMRAAGLAASPQALAGMRARGP